MVHLVCVPLCVGPAGSWAEPWGVGRAELSPSWRSFQCVGRQTGFGGLDSLLGTIVKECSIFVCTDILAHLIPTD